MSLGYKAESQDWYITTKSEQNPKRKTMDAAEITVEGTKYNRLTQET